ncbi:MAG: hypothetical protein ACI35P_13950 [Bacillus sp. (in: firmicutes)]
MREITLATMYLHLPRNEEKVDIEEVLMHQWHCLTKLVKQH